MDITASSYCTGLSNESTPSTVVRLIVSTVDCLDIHDGFDWKRATIAYRRLRQDPKRQTTNRQHHELHKAIRSPITSNDFRSIPTVPYNSNLEHKLNSSPSQTLQLHDTRSSKAAQPHHQRQDEMKGNIVIAIIIIILFLVLGLIGFGIYWAQTRVGGARGGSSTGTGTSEEA